MENTSLCMTRNSFEAAERTLLQRGSSAIQADVYIVNHDGSRLLVKDFSRRPWLVRHLGIRYVIDHECKALQGLAGIDGIPLFRGKIDADAFAQVFFDDTSPIPSNREVPPDEFPRAVFFDDLERILHEIHDRGYCFGDFRRKNILIDRDQRAYVVDFATALSTPGRWNLPMRFLHRLVCHADQHKLFELRALYCPQSLTPEEVERALRRPWHVSIGRFWRRYIYRNVIKPKRWRKRYDDLRARLSTTEPR